MDHLINLLFCINNSKAWFNIEKSVEMDIVYLVNEPVNI